MENSYTEFPSPKIRDQKKSQKLNPKSQIFWIWRLGFGICFGFWILILGFLVGGCGDIDEDIDSLTISPSNVTIGVNQTQLFTATAKDSLGIVVEIDPSWSADSNIGTISSTGLFTAGDSAGSGTVMATYGDKIASATVTVTENGWLSGRIQSLTFGYLAGIKVYLQELPTFLDFSDSNGNYSISDIPSGDYTAWTDATETFQAASQEVTIERGATTTWYILLENQPGIPVVPTTTLPSF